MSSEEMNNERLINYSETHCQTPRALFHGKHIRRMIEMAGCPANWPDPANVPDTFFAVHDEMLHLVRLARDRMKVGLVDPKGPLITLAKLKQLEEAGGVTELALDNWNIFADDVPEGLVQAWKEYIEAKRKFNAIKEKYL